MLFVAARCRIKPEYCQEFATQVKTIIPLVRSESGCRRYELHTDVFDTDLFVFCEEWESQHHLDEHIATPHMQEHFSRTAEWRAAPTELTIYEVSGVQTVSL